jgi:hypothetical protein
MNRRSTEKSRAMKTIAGVLWIVLIGVWTSGCSGAPTPEEACEEHCEWAVDHCGGNSSASCSPICKSIQSLAAHMGCSKENDADELCANDASSCDTNDACASQNAALVFCIGSFCSTHPDDPECGNGVQ